MTLKTPCHLCDDFHERLEDALACVTAERDQLLARKVWLEQELAHAKDALGAMVNNVVPRHRSLILHLRLSIESLVKKVLDERATVQSLFDACDALGIR